MERGDLTALIERTGGVLALEPAYVARSWMTPGRRLGLPPEKYDVGERGAICERWLASTTLAANEVAFPGEGVSTLRDGGAPLDEVVAAAPDLLMGAEYARAHDGLGRLAKIFDYGDRVPFHIHPPTDQAAAVGLTSKDEAYYYLPGADLGPHPESFFGLHASLTPELAREALLVHLDRWDDDRVLELSKAYHLYEEGGYFVPSGVLHAPGTALTLELQEDSDAMAFLQARCGDVQLSRGLLMDALGDAGRERGAEAIFDWVDWDLNLMADFHSAYAIKPSTIRDVDGVREDWIFWGSSKFQGKRLRLAPGARATSVQAGVYSVFVWQGAGSIGGHPFEAGSPGDDEFLIVHSRAVEGVEFVNTSQDPVELIMFFGPDINDDAPRLRLPEAAR